MKRLRYAGLDVRVSDKVMELLELTFDVSDKSGYRATLELPAYFPGESTSTLITFRILPMVPWLFFTDDEGPSEDPAGSDLAEQQLEHRLQKLLRRDTAVQSLLAGRGYFAKAEY